MKLLSLFLFLILSLQAEASFVSGSPINCAAGTSGQLYTTDGTTCSWTTAGSGSGSFNGPGSAVAHDLVSFADTTGQLGEDSGLLTSTVITTTNTKTLTNKTLTSPALAGATWSGTTATGQGNSKILETDSSGNLTAATAITAAQLPNPGASSLGGVQSKASVSHNYLTQISTSGVVSQAQPVLADLSDVTIGVTALNNLATDWISGHVPSPGNSTYILDAYAAVAYTISALGISTSSGTITAAVKIGGTNVTSCSAVSVTSTPGSTTCTAANTVAAGNVVTLVMSSNSSAADLAWTLKITRN